MSLNPIAGLGRRQRNVAKTLTAEPMLEIAIRKRVKEAGGSMLAYAQDAMLQFMETLERRGIAQLDLIEVDGHKRLAWKRGERWDEAAKYYRWQP